MIIFSKSIINIMFDSHTLYNVGIKLITGDRVQQAEIDVEISKTGEVNLNELALYLRKKYKLEHKLSLFYFDHSHSDYRIITDQALLGIHFTSLICENLVTFKGELKHPDQLLSHAWEVDELKRAKRSRQRKIQEAFVLVEKWRFYYTNGIQQKGHKININLDESAQLVGVPRKTLEDYFLLFRLGKARQFNFAKNRQQKMGSLRSYLRDNAKEKFPAQKQQEQRHFFKHLHSDIVGEKSQEQIFDILKSNFSYSKSEGYLMNYN